MEPSKTQGRSDSSVTQSRFNPTTNFEIASAAPLLLKARPTPSDAATVISVCISSEFLASLTGKHRTTTITMAIAIAATAVDDRADHIPSSGSQVVAVS